MHELNLDRGSTGMLLHSRGGYGNDMDGRRQAQSNGTLRLWLSVDYEVRA